MAMRAVRGEITPQRNENQNDIFVGDAQLVTADAAVSGGFVDVDGEKYYRIEHYDQMRPFFMSLVSGGDHWLFISSTGGVTAGRTNADMALFPYETEDKLTMNHETAGSKTIFLITRNGRTQLWEPFSDRYGRIYKCERHLYKNIYGNKLIFEEINQDLGLRFRLMWRTGERFGFIKSSRLDNQGEACTVSVLDGLLNLLPYGASAAMQNVQSNLLNAYKRNERHEETGLGIFAMSATLTDQAEPSESLKATVAWQIGLDDVDHLLSAGQVDAFRRTGTVNPEKDVLGRAGAYMVHDTFELPAEGSRRWHIVADVNQNAADVVALTDFLKQEPDTILEKIAADIDKNTAALVNYVAAADGLQQTAAESTVIHHFANVMFNVMRGGIFADGYRIEKNDLISFMRVRNRPVVAEQADFLAALPDQIDIRELYTRATAEGSADLLRLCYEYLPITFSRRHGDPSRPWNRFAINLKHEDGTPRLDYQGNWRDIFQNWEPLGYSFPVYVPGMIAKFLNATTADGYNPYRVTREGIEWEVPEPENPWANIGYWSDHQIIYLQKLLELADEVQPGAVKSMWNRPLFSYADVPYRIRPYEEILADWYDTIDFAREADKVIEAAVEEMGTDAKLVRDVNGRVRHVTMIEKLLVLLLAKLTNLVPEGGIWMNTQRPEWNDANNALVGKGISVVTAAYVRRFIAFWRTQLADHDDGPFEVNTAVVDLLNAVQAVFNQHTDHLKTGFDDQDRRAVMDALGAAATVYRSRIYNHIPTDTQTISAEKLDVFLTVAQSFVEQTLQANRREDGLYHSYNILKLGADTAAVKNLYLMLEGQVAILSAGMLAPDEALHLVHQLRRSDLYREDQHSYMLYPNRSLPQFQEKNWVPAARVADSDLVAALKSAGDVRLLLEDVHGDFHFHGSFRNVKDVDRVLDEMAAEPALQELVAAERPFMQALFEETFNHSAFTGRSGTFFAYEGLGSIYWHMVSKLLLAVQECYFDALETDAPETAALEDAYYDVRNGIGFNKPPQVYGAFPTDPYSHTPYGGGAGQPGMTGQVKEELLTRLGELGVSIEDGRIRFAPAMLQKDEFLTAEKTFPYVDINKQSRELSLAADSLAFTLCQTPVVYERGDDARIRVRYADGRESVVDGRQLDAAVSTAILNRDGTVEKITAVVDC